MNYEKNKFIVFDEVNTDEAVSFELKEDDKGLYFSMQKETADDEDYWTWFEIKLRDVDVDKLICFLGEIEYRKRLESIKQTKLN